MSDVPVTAWWLMACCALVLGARHGAFGAGLASGLAVTTRPNLVLLLPVMLALAWWSRPAGNESRLGRRASGASPGSAQGCRRSSSSSHGSTTRCMALLGPPATAMPRSCSRSRTCGSTCSATRAGSSRCTRRCWPSPRSAFSSPWRPPRNGVGRSSARASPWFSSCARATSPTHRSSPGPTSASSCRRLRASPSSPASRGRGCRTGPDVGGRRSSARLRLASCAGHGVGLARSRGAFELASREARYERVAEWVRDHTTDAALVLCGQHSGSIHHTAGRTVLRWDLASAGRRARCSRGLPSSRGRRRVRPSPVVDRARRRRGSRVPVAPRCIERARSARLAPARSDATTIPRPRLLRGRRRDVPAGEGDHNRVALPPPVSSRAGRARQLAMAAVCSKSA